MLAGGAANGWLILTGFSGIPNESIIGIEVVAEVDPYNPSVIGALVYGANLPDCGDDAGAVIDGDGATWYGWTTTGGTLGVTALFDFGAATTVGKFSFVAEVFGDTTPTWDVQYSADGVNWTVAPTLTGTFLPAGPQVISIAMDLATIGVGLTPVTARYWRVCVGDQSTGGLARPRIYTFTLFAADRTTVLTPSPSLSRTVEMSVSRSGTPTDVHTVSLPSSGGLVSVGGPSSLFSQSWIPGDFNSGSAAIYIRRGSGTGEHTGSPRSVDRAYLIVYSTAVGGSLGTTMSVTRKCFIAIEKNGSGVSTRGAGTPATHRVMSAQIDFVPDVQIDRHNVMGSKLPDKFVLTKASSEGSLDEGKPCYKELGFWLACICGAPVSTEIVTGVWQHTFTLKSNSQDDIRSLAVEIGEDAGATGGKKVAYAILNQLAFELSREDISMTGALLAQKISEPVTITAGPNDVQTLTVTATGGTGYALEFMGARTSTLAFNANNSAIQTALRALSTIGGAHVTVTGSGPYVITFNGNLAGRMQEKIRVVDLGLTGGTATLVHTTVGGIKELEYIPVKPGDISLYYASSIATLATNKLAGVSTSGFEISDRFNVRWVQDKAKTSWSKHVEALPTVALDITAESVPLNGSPDTGYTGASGISLWADCEAGVQKFVRMEAISDTIVASAIPYSLTITMFAGIADGGGYENSDFTIDRDLQFQACMNADWGKAMEVVLVNDVAPPSAGQSAY